MRSALLRLLLPVSLLAALMSGCTETPKRPIEIANPPEGEPLIPDPFGPGPLRQPGRPVKPSPPTASPKPVRAAEASSRPVNGDAQAAVQRLLPSGVSDREGWARDIAQAFQSMRIKPSTENLCAVLAVTEQESSFQADPPVAGLPGIVRHEIAKRRERYHLPEPVVNLALAVKSPDGRTYDQRIDALRTENDLNRLYADMIAELPLGKQLLMDYNPVRTGGPMQVSLKFAQARVKEVPYPYPIQTTLRDELFTRRGGMYFGTAYLLGYPAGYPEMLYRFADYNAGRYASRNAAFQAAVARLSGVEMDCDGDLLRYRDGEIDDEPSQTLQAVLTLAPRLQLTREAIVRDLRQEKSADFERTAVYARVHALARDAGLDAPPARLPDIRLNSPKISHGLTTSKFAQRVNQRYRNCLSRD